MNQYYDQHNFNIYALIMVLLYFAISNFGSALDSSLALKDASASATSNFTCSILIGKDGKILTSRPQAFAVIHWNTLIPITRSFSDFGFVVPDAFESGYTLPRVRQKVTQKDGKIIVVGYAFKKADNYKSRYFVIARYNADGTADKSFKNGEIPGMVVGKFAAHHEWCLADDVIIQHDDKILIAGSSNDFLAIARFNSDGSFDTSFGSKGIAVTNKVLPKVTTLEIKLLASAKA